jgi:hypothetical protein
VGAIDVKVTATDGSNAFASDEFRITVANVNDAPTLANAIAAPKPRPKIRRSASPCRRTRSRMWTRPTATR